MYAACKSRGATSKEMQIAYTYPQLLSGVSVGAIFSAKPTESPVWLVWLLMQAGDIESNSGPVNYYCQYCSITIKGNQTSFKCSHTDEHWLHETCVGLTVIAYGKHTAWKCQTHTPQPLVTKRNAKLRIKIMQININSIKSKIGDLEQLVTRHRPDIRE